MFNTVKHSGLDHVTTVSIYTSITIRINLSIALVVGSILFYAPQSTFLLFLILYFTFIVYFERKSWKIELFGVFSAFVAITFGTYRSLLYLERFTTTQKKNYLSSASSIIQIYKRNDNNFLCQQFD